MNRIDRIAALTCSAVCAVFVAACGGDADRAVPNAPAAPAPAAPSAPAAATGGGHVHQAPRGGLLVILAEETAHVELLLDRTRGRLDAHLLGPHAHTPLKSGQNRIWIELEGGAENLRIPLEAQGNVLTGDRAGSTSHFAAIDDRLKSVGPLKGSLGTVEVLGRRFEGARFESSH